MLYDFVKELGEGVDRIYREMESAGLPEPEYRQTEFMLYAVLRNKNWGKEGAAWPAKGQEGVQDRVQDTEQDEKSDMIEKLLSFCNTPRSRQEMMAFTGLSARRSFNDHYLKPLLESGRLMMTIPDKPNSKYQKYVTKQ